MKENKNLDFTITKNSLDILKNISTEMVGKTFHFYTHVLYDIRTSLGSSEKTYLEIGSYAGCSISLVSSHEYVTKCYSVDLGSPIPQEIVEKNVGYFKNKESSFKYFKGDSKSYQTLQSVKNEVSNIDILFIDGEHSYNGVISDFSLYSPLVSSGGFVVFDDYNDYEHSPEVRPAVDHIVNNLSSDYHIIGTIVNDLDFEIGSIDKMGGSLFLLKKK